MPTLEDVRTLRIECADCGRERWWKRSQIARQHIPLETPLSAILPRLCCSCCREEGLPGNNVVVSADFFEPAHHAAFNIPATRALG